MLFLLKTKPDSLTNQGLSGINYVKIVQTSEIAKTCFVARWTFWVMKPLQYIDFHIFVKIITYMAKKMLLLRVKKCGPQWC